MKLAITLMIATCVSGVRVERHEMQQQTLLSANLRGSLTAKFDFVLKHAMGDKAAIADGDPLLDAEVSVVGYLRQNPKGLPANAGNIMHSIIVIVPTGGNWQTGPCWRTDLNEVSMRFKYFKADSDELKAQVKSPKAVNLCSQGSPKDGYKTVKQIVALAKELNTQNGDYLAIDAGPKKHWNCQDYAQQMMEKTTGGAGPRKYQNEAKSQSGQVFSLDDDSC